MAATIVERLDRLEEGFAQLAAVQHCRSEVDEILGVLSDGLAAYRRRLLREQSIADAAIVERSILNRVAQDEALRFPHRRIVEALLAQYDGACNEYRELQFSRLVRAAKVGKSRAKAYLAALERRGFVERRGDGYRTWFRVKAQ